MGLCTKVIIAIRPIIQKLNKLYGHTILCGVVDIDAVGEEFDALPFPEINITQIMEIDNDNDNDNDNVTTIPSLHQLPTVSRYKYDPAAHAKYVNGNHANHNHSLLFRKCTVFSPVITQKSEPKFENFQ